MFSQFATRLLVRHSDELGWPEVHSSFAPLLLLSPSIFSTRVCSSVYSTVCVYVCVAQ